MELLTHWSRLNKAVGAVLLGNKLSRADLGIKSKSLLVLINHNMDILAELIIVFTSSPGHSPDPMLS